MRDPGAAVAAMTIPELYFLIADVGLVDAADLIALATPEQFQGCVDLEVWDRDRFQQAAFMPWIEILLEAGFEKVGEIWGGLDPELAALIIARHTRIFDLTLGEEPPDESEAPRIETPDRFFILEITSDSDDDLRLIDALIADLYRYDLAVARHLLMSARSEMQSHLEEMSYRWRSGRLADLGYPDFYEALEVFRPLDPRSVEIGEGTAEQPAIGGEEAVRAPGELPVPMLEQVMGRAFLARALGQISEAEDVERLEAALIILVNRVLSAARVSPGDEQAVVVGTEHATATLALGLETVSRGDIESAALVLRTVSLTRLHRVGYTVTLGLARAARQLAPRGASAGEPSTLVLEALLGHRPFFSRALELEPQSGVRPFESLADIVACTDHLRALASRASIVTALGVDLVAAANAETAPTLDAYGRTAVGWKLIGRDLAADSMTSANLSALVSRLEKEVDATPISAELFKIAQAEDIALTRADVDVAVARWTSELKDELEGLDADDIDPRFVTAVVLSEGRD